MRAFIAGLVLPLAMLFSSMAQAQDGQPFRYKAKPGDKQYFSIKSTLEQSQKINNIDVKNTIETTSIVEREVLEPDEKGNNVFREHHLHLIIEMQIGPLGEYTYDSKSTDNETGSTLGLALTPLYDAISGAFVVVTVSPQGEVLKVKGLKEAVEGGVDKDNPIAAQFALGAASEETARINYSEYFIQFPEKTLSAGDTWEIPYDLELGTLGKLKGKTVHVYGGPETVDGRRLHKATSSNEMKGDIEIKTAGLEIAGTVEIDASSGTAFFDAESGQLISRNSNISSSGDLVTVVGGMTIPIKQNQTQKIEIKRLDGPLREE